MTIAIILAGGYAKRMWPLTKDTAKALLEVDGYPNIHHIIKKLEKLTSIGKIIISTNKKFGNDFHNYIKEYSEEKLFTKPVFVITEPTLHEDEKLGAVGGLQYAIRQLNIEEDILLILGDNNFEDSLEKMITPERITIGTTQVTRSQACQLGIVTVTPDNKVIDIQEKPKNPKSNTASTGIYHIPKTAITHVLTCKTQDNIGNMLKHLHSYNTIHTYQLNGQWKDIGTHEYNHDF